METQKPSHTKVPLSLTGHPNTYLSNRASFYAPIDMSFTIVPSVLPQLWFCQHFHKNDSKYLFSEVQKCPIKTGSTLKLIPNRFQPRH